MTIVLCEVERKLNAYLNSNKLEQLKNQHAEKLRSLLKLYEALLVTDLAILSFGQVMRRKPKIDPPTLQTSPPCQREGLELRQNYRISPSTWRVFRCTWDRTGDKPATRSRP
ncbi:hypothetical protein TNCV_1474451 [Trichonephila clavipes]|nr:hypothetical protein TNCV_1474451 [Trichonephila clavipes]